ncbi:hypothetical protein C7S16_6340 [Burkholderia thailandensis]|uniref:Uncharacterized protein n=1 Tax=Burkholderia thailandensis TaxID=57975 RepID=A0AAW9CNU8_BURTH|nr:hypothetical protein [Burkholderia thailandensis]
MQDVIEPVRNSSRKRTSISKIIGNFFAGTPLFRQHVFPNQSSG